jgi:uncharacterized membrane-anchored protein YitT (DUF2179 family)
MKNTFQIVKEYIFIFSGASLMGFSIAVFLIDARVVPGGISGIAMTVHYLNENIPVGLALWLMNIPLFIWGFFELGWAFAKRTVFGFTVSSFSIDLFHGEIPGLTFFALNKSSAIVYLMQHDFFFFIVISAVITGVGMGLVFKFKGTTGGVDIIVSIIQKRFGIKPGNSIISIDIIIITSAALVIHFQGLSPDRPAISLAFYAVLLTFILSKIIDLLVDGFDYARSVLIITDKSKEVSEAIIHKLSRGATALKGRGLYRNIDREIIMTVVTRREITFLEDIIKEIDPKAFVIVNSVHEVLGEGFRRRT